MSYIIAWNYNTNFNNSMIVVREKITLRRNIIKFKIWNKNICIKSVFPFIIKSKKKQVAKLPPKEDYPKNK